MQWTVIGAGPAGIAAIGKLLDSGIPPREISWIDLHFKVGDFGQKWHAVSSNTKVDLFLKFLRASEAFSYDSCPIDFELNHLPLNETCKLSYMSQPLQWVTDHLRTRVNCFQAFVHELKHQQGSGWDIVMDKDLLHSKNVILAMGSDPKTLPAPNHTLITVEQAMNPSLLKTVCGEEDTVAVFGSSHTAVVAMQNLIEAGVKEVVNFYLSPLKYAVYEDGWILYDNTGLKGQAALWARKYLEGDTLPNLKRYLVSDENFQTHFLRCQKVIYAIGFERRKFPQVYPFDEISYDEHTGIIAPGLFGVGIAFPQGKFDRLGNYELNVGLWKFMNTLNEWLPLWQKSGG